MVKLWGSGDTPFAAALAAGTVSSAERRAVALLASTCDAWRVGIYLASGRLPAIGNLTRALYVVRRFNTVLEYDGDRAVRSHCIEAVNRPILPETDHVALVRMLIEGEEREFLARANSRRLFGSDYEDGPLTPVERSLFAGPDRPEWADLCASRARPENVDFLAKGARARWEYALMLGRAAAGGSRRPRRRETAQAWDGINTMTAWISQAGNQGYAAGAAGSGGPVYALG